MATSYFLDIFINKEEVIFTVWDRQTSDIFKVKDPEGHNSMDKDH